MPGRERLDGVGGRLRHARDVVMEPAAKGLLLVAAPALVLVTAWVSYRGMGPHWVAGMMLALLVALRLVATRFSRGVLRALTVAAIVVSVGGLLSVGRAERVRARGRAARASATALAAEASQLRSVVGVTSPADDRRRAEATVAALRALAPRPATPDAPATLGSQIATELESALPGPTDESGLRRVADLEARLLKEPDLGAAGGPGGPLVVQVQAAVDAVRRLVAGGLLDRGDQAVDAVCRQAYGTFEVVATGAGAGDRTCAPVTHADDARKDTVLVRRRAAVEQAQAGLLLAQAAKAGGRGDPAEVDRTLQARRDALGQALAGIETDIPSTDFLVVLREGGNALVRTIPLVNRFGVPLALALVGWVVLAGVGIMGYRHYEIINGDSGLGPVRVTGDDADAERFRTYLLWNVPEPGAVPGASALKPVTDLLGATAAGVPGAAWLQRVLEAITAAVAIDHGYTVECKILEEAAAGAQAGTTVAVRVRVTRTGALLGQHVTIQPTTKKATREAAYWAAAVILSRSPRVPGWAEWDKETSDSLAAYFQESDQGRPDIGQLREAVQQAPRSGLLCLELANAESLEGNHFRAFRLALRVATIHPRYIAGRYRLAVTANLLAADPTACWGRAADADRQAVLAALGRYGPQTAPLVDALRAEPGPEGGNWARALCGFALGELERLGKETSVTHAVCKALRLQERAYWYELLRSAPGTNDYRRQFQQSIESSKLAVKARGGFEIANAELVEQQDRVDDPRTLWLVAYNLACYHAIRHGQVGLPPVPHVYDHAGAAVRLLETAVERPGSHQLTHAWTSKDPDLDSLRGNPRFRRFQDGLYKKLPGSDEASR